MIVDHHLRRIVLEACVLVAFAVVFGLTVNHSLVVDALQNRLVPKQTEPSDTLAIVPMPALLEDVQYIMATGGVVVDARSPELFAAGRIQGSLSLPLVDIDSELGPFLEEIEKDRVIVVYCSGFGCPDSFDLAVLLIEAGYADVRVFEGGYPEWRDAGLPIDEAKM